MLLALVGGASAVSSPPPPPPPAPPCTVAMLKQRPAGDKSWPVACSQVTLDTSYGDLDLSGAHLLYGDFEGATFQAFYESIRLNGAGLAHADLSGSTFTAKQHSDTTIDFTVGIAAADERRDRRRLLRLDGDASPSNAPRSSSVACPPVGCTPRTSPTA